ncbi:hypothetical protein [Polymorphospora lycopeni]|uniref:CHAP domain-containing protein n=1 Tax=Polymorphospora lycopeni TaxID=3140240 RepID=A0ABV5CJQ8_9ACTN
MSSLRAARTAIATTVAVAAMTAATAVPAAAGPVFDFYFANGYIAANEVRTQLGALSWPGQAARNYYPGANGNPNGSSAMVWGTPGSPSTYTATATCAPMVTLSLKRAYGADWATNSFFQTHFGSTSPTSAQYHNAINAGTVPHVKKVGKLTDAFVGDIIAIRYNGGSGAATGHTAYFAGRTPYDMDNNPATIEWAVRVLDSTSEPHGVAGSIPQDFRDSRTVGAAEYDGLGEGHMVFRTDSAGTILGHWWGVNESTYRPVSDRPVTIGRITRAA